MKAIRKKSILAAAAVLPFTFALAACGGGDKTSSEGSESGGTDDAAPEGNELTVWAWDPAFNIYAMQEAEKIYQQDHPDFKLNIVETPWDDLQTKITTLAQSQELGELPDIFLIQNNAAQKNILNYPEIFSTLTGGPIDFSEFPTSVVDYSTVDGENYAVPFDSGTAITALRTDVLAEAGYTVDDFTDITWDEYITKGKDILEKTGKPILSGVRGESDMIMMMLQSAGASLFDAEGNPTIADNAAVKKTLEQYAELVESGVMVEKNSWDEYVGSFVNSEVAGTINGVWIVGSIQTAEDQSGKWEITNLPKLEGVDGATNYSANGGSSWAISSNANKELAEDFLAATFAGSTELFDTILPSSGAVSNWIPAGSSTVYQEPQPFFSDQPIYEMVVEFGEKVPSNNTGAYYYEGRDAIGVAATEYMNGTDLDTALADAQSKVEFAMQ